MSGTKAAKAGFLIVFRRIWGSVVNLLVMAWLARNLEVSDFGEVAAALFLVNLGTIITSSGLSDYVIYYQGDDERRVAESALWLNTLLAIVTGGLILLGSAWWSEFFKAPAIQGILELLVLSFMSKMIVNVPKAWFRKHLDYKPMVKWQLVFSTVGTLSKVLFVFMGFGVYSLVMPMAIFEPILTIMLIYKSGITYKRIAWSSLWTYWKDIYHYTRFLLGSRLLSRIVNEGDNAIVGKFISLEALGYYNLAFQFANIVTSHVTVIVNDVAFPLLSKLKSNMKAFAEAYSQMLTMLAYIGAPVVGVSIVFAHEIIFILYGEKFAPSAYLLQILSVFAWGRMASSPSGIVFNALGKSKTMFYFNIVFAPLFLLSVWLGSLSGLAVFCMVVTAARLMAVGPIMWMASTLMGVNPLTQFKSLLPPLVVSIASGIVTYIIYSWLPQNQLYMLIPCVLLFLVLYTYILKWAFKSSYETVADSVVKLHPYIKKFAHITNLYRIK
jgi:O-antigen/teichoic acid export membrane protein